MFKERLLLTVILGTFLTTGCSSDYFLSIRKLPKTEPVVTAKKTPENKSDVEKTPEPTPVPPVTPKPDPIPEPAPVPPPPPAPVDDGPMGPPAPPPTPPVVAKPPPTPEPVIPLPPPAPPAAPKPEPTPVPAPMPEPVPAPPPAPIPQPAPKPAPEPVDDGPMGPPAPPAKKYIKKETRYTVPAEVDVIVVVDNSLSMYPEQEKLSHRFSNFLDNLTDLDWRVAMTSTDVTKMKKNPAVKGQRGALIPFAQGLTYLEKSNLDSHKLFAETLINIGENGDGTERGVYALNLAITNNQDKWIRPTAHLAAIIISDENECSTGVKFCPKITNKNEFGFDKAESVLKTVTSSLGKDKTISVHSIIIKPGDKRCLHEQKIQPGKEHKKQLLAAYEGTEYAKLSLLTNGIVGSVCEDDYTNQLVNMAASVKRSVGTINLSCVPNIDDDHSVEVTVNGRPLNSREFSVESNKIVLADPELNINSKIIVNYFCEKSKP